jgi:hypothetical protein
VKTPVGLLRWLKCAATASHLDVLLRQIPIHKRRAIFTTWARVTTYAPNWKIPRTPLVQYELSPLKQALAFDRPAFRKKQ